MKRENVRLTGKKLRAVSIVNDVRSCAASADINDNETEAVKENREPIEFKDLYPHAIRHTFCSRCFEKGMDAKVVQMLMGHQHYSTTIDIYTHVTETKFEEEIAKFGSVSEKQKVQKNKNSTQCA